MKTLGYKIKECREKLGYSQEELAKMLGYKSRSTINKIELGINDITQSKIAAFATALQTTPSHLMGWDEQLSRKPIPTNTININAMVYIPILGSVRAGVGGTACEEIIGYEQIPSNWIKSGNEYCALKVEGDSMSPKLDDGDTVLLQKQSSVDSGSLAVVIVDGEEGVVKRVFYGDNWIDLISENPYYPKRHFENEEIQNIFVVGLVTKIIRDVL